MRRVASDPDIYPAGSSPKSCGLRWTTNDVQPTNMFSASQPAPVDVLRRRTDTHTSGSPAPSETALLAQDSDDDDASHFAYDWATDAEDAFSNGITTAPAETADFFPVDPKRWWAGTNQAPAAKHDEAAGTNQVQHSADRSLFRITEATEAGDPNSRGHSSASSHPRGFSSAGSLPARCSSSGGSLEDPRQPRRSQDRGALPLLPRQRSAGSNACLASMHHPFRLTAASGAAKAGGDGNSPTAAAVQQGSGSAGEYKRRSRSLDGPEPSYAGSGPAAARAQ